MKIPEDWKAGRFVRNEKYKLYQDGKFYNLEIDIDENNPLDINMLSRSEKKIYKKFKKIQDSAPQWEYSNKDIPGDLKKKN